MQKVQKILTSIKGFFKQLFRRRPKLATKVTPSEQAPQDPHKGSFDIGIDLGTTKVMIYDTQKGVLLQEPSVIAVNTKNDEILAVGREAYEMLGKTPDFIRAVKPLADGVISDYHMTEAMVQHYVRLACGRSIFKPRVVICVPSGVTNVESRAVVDAAMSAGARKVYLIEEPVAAAIGAGIDISKPQGHIVVDIGGGTTDVAVISLNGIVEKTSVKVAGEKFNDAVIRQVRSRFGVLIGERMAQKVKIEAVNVMKEPVLTTEATGRNLRTGLPERVTVCSEDLYEEVLELAEQIVAAIASVLEKTPPELVGDIHTNGILLTGGGAQLRGLRELIEERTGVKTMLADEPINCVAIGTGKAFEHLDDLMDGFIAVSSMG